MLVSIWPSIYDKEFTAWSVLLTFFASVLALRYISRFLPHDLGRAFAVNGQLSKGKPRGAGIIFVLVFVLAVWVFTPMNTELFIYSLLVAASMLSGYLDDGADKPWGEGLKGLIDLVVALTTAITFINFNPSLVGLFLPGRFIPLNSVFFCVLMTALIWVSINVTNCADGVDGLCGSVSLVSLVTLYFIFVASGHQPVYAQVILLMAACVMGYLWFNVSPSQMLMGDAGSRAIGFFIALAAVKSNYPWLYPLIAGVLLIDGGVGLVKLFLLRYCKIHILKHVRTPLHDFARKEKYWSDPQVVFRFVTIQVVLSFGVVLWVMR